MTHTQERKAFPCLTPTTQTTPDAEVHYASRTQVNFFSPLMGRLLTPSQLETPLSGGWPRKVQWDQTLRIRTRVIVMQRDS